MNERMKRMAAALGCAAAVASGGCETTGDTRGQVTGAGIGAALGCGVGALVSGDAKGCATGAAIGGVLGWGAVAISQYNARQVRTPSADDRIYGVAAPVDIPQVRVRRGSNAPKTVAPGGQVAISTDYSVLLPSGRSSASVTESWLLKKDGRTIAEMPSTTAHRTPGGWQAEATIDVPPDVPPGTYVIEHRVQAGSSYDTDESTFVVRA